MFIGVIIETDIIASDILKNSDSETQSNMPDVPYEPDLDIEIDFPRGNQSTTLWFGDLLVESKCNFIIGTYLIFVFMVYMFIFSYPSKMLQLLL